MSANPADQGSVEMRSDELGLIRELALFADMDSDNFSELMQLAYFQRFPPQVQLITEGDPADFLYVVIGGSDHILGTSLHPDQRRSQPAETQATDLE